jgi:hypothetical protein
MVRWLEPKGGGADTPGKVATNRSCIGVEHGRLVAAQRHPRWREIGDDGASGHALAHFNLMARPCYGQTLIDMYQQRSAMQHVYHHLAVTLP